MALGARAPARSGLRHVAWSGRFRDRALRPGNDLDRETDCLSIPVSAIRRYDGNSPTSRISRSCSSVFGSRSTGAASTARARGSGRRRSGARGRAPHRDTSLRSAPHRVLEHLRLGGPPELSSVRPRRITSPTPSDAASERGCPSTTGWSARVSSFLPIGRRVERLRDDQGEHRVAQELEPLVALSFSSAASRASRPLVCIGRVAQRRSEKRGVGEAMPWATPSSTTAALCAARRARSRARPRGSRSLTHSPT